MKILNIIYIFLLIVSTQSCTKNEAEHKSISTPVAKKDSSGIDFISAKKDIEGKLSDDFSMEENSYFLIISNLSKSETKKIVDNTIVRAVECFANDYFEKKPDEATTIFLFKDDKSYRYWAKKLYDDDDLSRFGYYKPSYKVMLMNISTGTGTLVHEMTHALVRYDFPDIPSWFNEGLGSLYERCSLNDKLILGYVNWRLPELQDAIKDKSYTSIEKLIKTDYDGFYGKNSSFNYAQARYLCMFLQEKDLLKKFYKQFRDSYSDDNTGKKQLESVFGKSLYDLEIDYLAWVKTLKYE
jgi:hypothetical protein